MILYHGSPKKLKVLKPQQAKGISKKADRQKGVYATHKKDRAIAMTLIHLRGIVGGKRLNFPKGKPIGTIFEGWPIQKEFYLYKIPQKDFKKIDGWQWFSSVPVKVNKYEKLKTKDYIKFLRKGTKREKEIFDKRIKHFKEINPNKIK